MGDRNWQGRPVLAAKIGPGDSFWPRTDFFVTGQVMTTASVSLPRVPVWWYIHSQLFLGYHYSLTIDSVRAPLTEAQGLIACSISARAY